MIALQQIIEDMQLQKELTEFFESQANEEASRAIAAMAMDKPDADLSRKSSCMAVAFTEALPRLKAYIKAQLQKPV